MPFGFPSEKAFSFAGIPTYAPLESTACEEEAEKTVCL